MGSVAGRVPSRRVGNRQAIQIQVAELGEDEAVRATSSRARRKLRGAAGGAGGDGSQKKKACVRITGCAQSNQHRGSQGAGRRGSLPIRGRPLEMNRRRAKAGYRGRRCRRREKNGRAKRGWCRRWIVVSLTIFLLSPGPEMDFWRRGKLDSPAGCRFKLKQAPAT